MEDTAPPTGHSAELESLSLDDDLSVTINALVSVIRFIPNQVAVFEDSFGGTVNSPNAVLRLIDPGNATADIIVFPQTGSNKIINE